MSSSPPPPPDCPDLRPKGELLETPCPAVEGRLGVEDEELERELAPITLTARANVDKPDPELPPLPLDCAAGPGRPLDCPFVFEDCAPEDGAGGITAPNPYPSSTALTISHRRRASLTSLAIVSKASFALTRFGKSGWEGSVSWVDEISV